MPSSSRKRNKGKERKAKKAENEKFTMRDVWLCMLAPQEGCDHGCNMIPDVDHPVSNFMNDFFIKLTVMDGGIFLLNSFERYPQVWNDDGLRNILLDVLLRLGANMLVNDDAIATNMYSPMSIAPSRCCPALRVAATILVLEQYGKTNNFNLALVGRTTSSKRHFLATETSSSFRDVSKFYRKRVSCKCLKRMHLEARKTIPKMGKCNHCQVEKERAYLSVCGTCRAFHYCSRECQVAALPNHKPHCNHIAKTHQSSMAHSKLV